jgi:hypothetical protein
MGRLSVDVVKKAEADFFGLIARMAKVEKNYIGPSEEFLKLVDAAAAVGAEGEAVTEGARDGFA